MSKQPRRAPRRRWTDAERDIVRAHYATTRTEDLAKTIDRTRSAVSVEAGKLGLHKDPAWVAENARQSLANPNHPARKTQFKKGHVPWTAGSKGQGLVGLHPNTAANHYKRGNLSGFAAKRVLPLGSYRVNDDGIVDVKVSTEPGPQTRRWKAVHRVVWEAAHGPVPKGHAVVFLPGRRTSDPALITLDALEMITQAELMRRNSLHRMGPELASLVQLRGVLTRAINSKEKEAA